MFVVLTPPQQQPEPPRSDLIQPARPRILALEATGVVIIAVLVLILTVVRYWHHIPWSAR